MPYDEQVTRDALTRFYQAANEKRLRASQAKAQSCFESSGTTEMDEFYEGFCQRNQVAMSEFWQMVNFWRQVANVKWPEAYSQKEFDEAMDKKFQTWW